MIYTAMKFKLILFVLLCANNIIFAQSSYDSEFIVKLKDDVMKGKDDKYEKWKAFEGILGKDKRVYFLLSTYIYNPKETKIWGEYIYAKYNKPIKLEGTVKGSRVYLKEFVEGKHTGTLIFDTEEDTGEWINNAGLKYSIDIESCALKTYVQQYYSNRLKDIKDKNFKTFVKGYKAKMIPSFSEDINYPEDDRKRIERKIAAKYLKEGGYEDFNDNQAGYLYGDAFFTENYIYLFTIEYYFPGAFGIEDQMLLVHIFDYDGRLKSTKNIGCDCFDSDMGIEAEHMSNSSILVDWAKITVFTKSNSTYFELDKEVNTSEVDYYKITKEGELLEQ